jgi:hypothetical protein
VLAAPGVGFENRPQDQIPERFDAFWHDHTIRPSTVIALALLFAFHCGTEEFMQAIVALYLGQLIFDVDFVSATQYSASFSCGRRLSRGGTFIAQANVVGQFVRQIEELVPPSNSILALPYQPMFYFLCDVTIQRVGIICG